MTNNRLSRIYWRMLDRCYNKKNQHYCYYGANGITVCAEWTNKEKVKQYSKGWLSFKKWALSCGYKDNLTLDRINVNDGYSPENCRWVSMEIQNNNRSNSVIITYNGVSNTLPNWCKLLGLNYKKTYKRLHCYHWDIEKLFNTK